MASEQFTDIDDAAITVDCPSTSTSYDAHECSSINDESCCLKRKQGRGTIRDVMIRRSTTTATTKTTVLNHVAYRATTTGDDRWCYSISPQPLQPLQHSHHPQRVKSWLSSAAILLILHTLMCHMLVTNAQPIGSNPTKTVNIKPGEKFYFDCPPVDDPHKVTSYQVSWMHNNAVWLKINEGHLLITNLMTSFYPRTVGLNRNVVSVSANDHRYKFTYDELNGMFSMSIDGVKYEDTGIWKCTVETKRASSDSSYLMYTDYKQLKVTDTPQPHFIRPVISAVASGGGTAPKGTGTMHMYPNSHSSYNHAKQRDHVYEPSRQTNRNGNNPSSLSATFTLADNRGRAGDSIVFQRVGSSGGSAANSGIQIDKTRPQGLQKGILRMAEPSPSLTDQQRSSLQGSSSSSNTMDSSSSSRRMRSRYDRNSAQPSMISACVGIYIAIALMHNF